MTVHGGDQSSLGLLGPGEGNPNSEVPMADEMRSNSNSSSPRAPRGPKRFISLINKGESTGAAYFMTQMPHLTSLVADSTALVLSISKDHFNPFVTLHPEIQPILEHDCGEQIARALTVNLTVPLFQSCSARVCSQ
eukprot:TRINITY_DN3436_c0_g1_i1.p1 TRINITY_DN3436_c0_g1~~TRINITY_DN3436_c0_g1_i1.p1  ORF type:complete len:136 (-),score=1.73 TRINITY_DN3436_c0_g1_i1:60-467(-)